MKTDNVTLAEALRQLGDLAARLDEIEPIARNAADLAGFNVTEIFAFGHLAGALLQGATVGADGDLSAVQLGTLDLAALRDGVLRYADGNPELQAAAVAIVDGWIAAARDRERTRP